jgi:hypothetical protein
LARLEPNETLTTVGADGMQTLHHQLLRRVVTHFFRGATLTISGPEAARLQREPAGAQHVQFACGVFHCECRRAHPFSRSERTLLHTLASVISRRVFELQHPSDDGSAVPAVEGTPEDWVVAEFLLSDAFAGDPSDAAGPLCDVIEVLRLVGVTSYENRKVTTGVLLGIGGTVERAQEIVQRETRFVRFNPSLATIKSLPRGTFVSQRR